jgi:hypothetical protein
MKRIVAAMVLVGLVVALVASPTPALAWRGHRAGYHGHGGGYFAGGLAIGALTGVIVGGILASRPAVVYEPAPVVVAPPPQPVYVPAPVYAAPQPVCSSYWVPQQYRDGVWVQGHWEQICR